MTTENNCADENPTPDESDLLKKRARQGAEAATDMSRVVISTACEVLGGVSRASAEAFHTLNQHMTQEQISAAGLPTKLVEGLLRGNAKFFEELSHSTEKVAEKIRSGQKAKI
jgi:hypothetical protein